MPREVLDIIVNATNNASRALKAINNDLRHTKKAAQGSASGVDDISGKLGTLLGLGAAAGIGIIAKKFLDLSMAAGRAADELSLLAYDSERTEAGFIALAGGVDEANAMLDGMRESLYGTAKDTDLMASANKAMMLGVTQDAEEMARLFEVATARGRRLGLDTGQSIDVVSRAIGRLSIKILDDIGIVRDWETVYESHAQTLGKTADALTEQEKRRAMTNVVLNDSIKLAEDDLSTSERLEAARANLRVSAGKLLNTTLDLNKARRVALKLVRGLKEEVEGRTVVLQYANRLMDSTVKMSRRQRMGLRAEITLFKAGLTSQRDFYHQVDRILGLDLEEWGRESAKGLSELEKSVEANRRGMYGLAGASSAAAEGISLVATAIGGYQRAQAGVSLADPWDAERAEAWKNFEFKKELAGKTAKERIAILEDERDRAISIHGERSYEVLEIEQDLFSEREALRRERESSHSDSLGRMSQEEQEFISEMRSALSGVLAPTQVTELDMARTRLGVYEDKVDEFVRRIRAEAQNSRGAWDQLIPQDILEQGGDALTVWTAEAEDMFYGLRWDELADFTGGAFDPAEAEERWLQAAENEIRAMRHYEARIESMLPRLAERLGGLTATERATVMPSSDIGGAVGGEVSQGIEQSLEEVDYGGSIIKELRNQTIARTDEIAEIGEQIGTALLEGAEGAITGDVIEGIAKALGPDMARWMQNAGVFEVN